MVGKMIKLLGFFLSLLVHALISLAFPLYQVFRLPLLAWRSIFYVQNITGKVVLITGAASGIGEQLAYEYAKRGARLALIDIMEDELKQVSDRARGLGSPDVIWVNANVSNAQHCDHYIKKAIQHFGQLDYLVNNAGIGGIPTLFENLTDLSIARNVMETNFWGSFYSTHFAIPHLRKSKGRIVVIASVNGHLPMPKSSIYNVSKAALISLYETLRVEIGGDVGITIVSPGLIDTRLTRGAYTSSMGKMASLPAMSAQECAKQIVESGCRGDAYLRVPQWISSGFLFKDLYPELATCLIRRFFFHNNTKMS